MSLWGVVDATKTVVVAERPTAAQSVAVLTESIQLMARDISRQVAEKQAEKKRQAEAMRRKEALLDEKIRGLEELEQHVNELPTRKLLTLSEKLRVLKEALTSHSK